MSAPGCPPATSVSGLPDAGPPAQHFDILLVTCKLFGAQLRAGNRDIGACADKQSCMSPFPDAGRASRGMVHVPKCRLIARGPGLSASAPLQRDWVDCQLVPAVTALRRLKV